LTLSNDAVYCQHALSIETGSTDGDDTPPENGSSFGWILPDRPHNSWGAEHISFWIKTPLVSAAAANGQTILKIARLEDINCILSSDASSTDCSREESLDAFVFAEIPIVQEDETWREIKVKTSSFPGLDLRRLRGWKVETTGVTTAAPMQILLDQLACLGGGAMLGASLNIATDFEDAVAEGTWRESFYQSETARIGLLVVSEGGKMNIDYTIERVEDWGGYSDWHALAPGNAYYNLSQATEVVIDHDLTRVATTMGRSIFRFILLESSNCTRDCDVDDEQLERWYCLHGILDEANSGQLVIPLVGSVEPTTPFWLTGWAGIKGNERLDVEHIKGFNLEFVLHEATPADALVSGSVLFQNIGAAISPDFVDAAISYVIYGFESTACSYEWQSSKGGVVLTVSDRDALFGEKSLLVEYDGDLANSTMSGYFESTCQKVERTIVTAPNIFRCGTRAWHQDISVLVFLMTVVASPRWAKTALTAWYQSLRPCSIRFWKPKWKTGKKFKSMILVRSIFSGSKDGE
jgi:hypothetical protein